jgi:glycerol-3-phosphate cytidylyltransferase
MAKKKTVVYTAGTWDLFHVGHLNILRKSKALGDVLVVGVSTDALVKSYKKVPPIIPCGQRVAIVKSCKYVDGVVLQSKLLDVRQLKQINADILTIGTDWEGKNLEGLKWMRRNRKVVYLPYTHSVDTTSIKRNILKNSYELIYAELKREFSDKHNINA